MTSISNELHVPATTVGISEAQRGLHLFVDGCYEPGSGQGGWAFVAYRDAVEIACGFGGVEDSANNSMELIAVLKAVLWINSEATGEAVIIWSDSIYAVKGCNVRRHIWKNNGWKKSSPNGNARSRTIANAELWKSVDRQLSRNALVTVAWCKGHSGVAGNERADTLADKGRLSMQGAR
ncbi:ribonuclease HI [Rhizobium leguminosarum]|uniref:ribonuclease H n=1 Tax=Rhizobium leguminosarum TaxID=384 RepID=A0AAE2MIV7_RHILE|nr:MULTISPECIES: ribonuclease H [Rhizobium]MBB4290106.1 ribonuclease HI [Rhizobium leguminosarum]MBB4296749.1 ribonuclease HI [Rhizobium leguminosarum]MBB4307990.1 ribonuclease HI [Rhizobium leguminosarum]MBB4415825.1 ribonuclease HI [Rhizobium leguminosarum]MBB4431208.1 ribonuclease HI [Rhizobium esperanzae]